VVTLLLTIYNSVVEQVENTICSSELPYTWNGVEFTQAGTQIVHLTTKNGCDSAVTMTLTVNPTYAVTDIQTICASELPYMWNNVQFTEAGTQTTTLQTINGCDSVVTMILTVNPTYEVTDVQTICASELPYMWNNVQFTEAGTQTTTLQTVNGCDSVVTMTLFVNPLYNVTEERSVCAAALPYTWNEVTFIEAGTQTATLQSVNNCDSVVTMILSVNDSYNVTDTKSICFNELPYTWNGVTFTEAGTQSVTLTAANDCDSVVTMILTVNPVYEVSEAKTICASELPYTWNNVQFTEAGTQTTTLQTINGCDSVVTMMLIVNSLYNVTEERSICAAALPYTWNGVTFTEAGTQTTTLQTINGCDSVVTMTLIVNPIYAVTDAQTICASELPYTWNNVQFTEAGTQTTTLQTVNGCDSVVTMNLTVNPLYNVTEERSVCAAALPYTWNEVIFTEAGTQSVTLTAANDCDSVVTMTLTVNPVYEVNDTQTICASELPYTWNNVQFTEAGTQTTTLQTVNGCDSVVTMNLTVNPLYNVTEERSVCAAALPYTWNGVTFTEASTQTATLHSVNNCDSVVTMILSVNSTYNVTDTKSICFNELPYTWNGVTFTEAGTQSVTLTAANDCDSVVTMILTVNPVYEVSEAKTICASELPYTWNNVQFTEAGTQTTTLQTVNGCDSVVTMTLTVNPTYAVTDTQTICASELPYTWNNVQFTEAGTQTTVLQTINGCDSVVTMTLFVNPLYNVTEERSVCAAALPYTWNEVIFTEAGTQTATLQSVNNCDSVVTMILSVNSTYIVTDTKSICFNELPYTWNGVTFTEAGTQSVTLTAANDCDSVVTMTLTVNPIYVVTDTQTICASQLPYTWNNVQFTEAGTQTTTLQTVNGCDSVVTMTLIVNPIYSVTDTQTICASELPYTWNNVQFTEAGTQTTTLQTVNGCDSVVTMTLFVNPLYNVTEERSVCAAALPYTWNEVTFTEAGTQSVTLTAANDCDSVVTMTLTVNLVYEVTDTQTICASELPYTWNNVQFTEAGTQTTTLQTVNGCDSVVTMTLTVNPVYEVTDAQTICASELPYTWNNVQFTEAGSQTTTLQTVNGCDSVVTMTLTVNPTYAVTDTQTICASELPYMWNNVQFTEAGTQTTNLQTVNGCDSVVTMTLIVNPIYSVTDTQTICASELPYTWNNVQFTEAGTQTTTLQTVNGCDSVVTMTLTVNPIYAVTDTQTICASELPYTWNNVQFTEAGTQTTTLQTVNGCDSVVTMTLTVNNPMHTATTEVACESFIWNGVTYTESGDYTYSHQDANGCTQVDTLHLTINNSVSIDAYLTINESDLPFTYGDTTFLPGSVQSGDYFFYFTTADGCDSIIVLHLTVEPVGISNYVANASMKVYPNPTSGVLNVELTTNNVQSSDVKIQVFDVYGKLLDIVETQNVASLQTTQIDLSPYSSGVYFIKAVVGDHQLGVRKIVKQ
jgi:adenosine/AMP kinase